MQPIFPTVLRHLHLTLDRLAPPGAGYRLECCQRTPWLVATRTSNTMSSMFPYLPSWHKEEIKGPSRTPIVCTAPRCIINSRGTAATTIRCPFHAGHHSKQEERCATTHLLDITPSRQEAGGGNEHVVAPCYLPDKSPNTSVLLILQPGIFRVRYLAPRSPSNTPSGWAEQPPFTCWNLGPTLASSIPKDQSFRVGKHPAGPVPRMSLR